MKKLISCIVALILLVLCTAGALADGNGTIVDYWTDMSNLTVYAAIRQSYRCTLDFSGAVDGSDEVPVKASALPSAKIGHIIVVDTRQPYCNTVNNAWLTYENAYQQILQKYLSSISNNELVRFIIAGAGTSYTETDWMMNNQAQDYVRSSIKLQTEAGETGAVTALNLAFKEAEQYTEGQPLFKNVFAVMDVASANSSLPMGSGTFPLFVATIAQSGTEVTDKKTQANSGNYEAYQSFAAANNGVYICLEHTGKGTLDCSSLTTQVTQTLNNLQYYVIDLSNTHRLIDYSKQSHTFSMIASSSDGERQINTLTTDVVPPSPEPIAADTPTPVPEATPVVARDGNDSNALRAINRLWELYYLEERTNSFDDSCRYAFMEFCRANGLEEKDEVDEEAFNLLLYGQVVAKATATPEPTPSPTPVMETATPVPKVYNGSTSTTAFYAIKQLQKLYYLDPAESHTAFDAGCMSAFLDLCIDNGISYDKDYIDDDAYQFLMSCTTPKATPTPEPVLTPTPEPTVPVEGYALNTRDGEGNAFISKMQSILAELNMFNGDYTPGLMDRATLDAAGLYCTTYGLLNTAGENAVSQQIVNDVLTMGENRTPYTTPEPSIAEKLISFLKQDIFSIGTFAVKTWMIVVLILALLFSILLVVILMRSRNSAEDEAAEVASVAAAASAGSMGDNDDEKTRPVQSGAGRDDDMLSTLPASAALRVTFTISGNCTTWTDSRLVTSENFVIGRGAGCDLRTEPSDRTVSSKHAILNSNKGTLYLRDVSTFHSTWVNGQTISSAEAVPEGDVTLPIRSSQARSTDYELSSGDEITLGEKCRIKVVW